MPAVATRPAGTTSATPKADRKVDWPSAVDYKDALQNPSSAFLDPFLKACTVEVYGPMKSPKARAGAFANVYKLTATNGQSTALRVFNYPNEERQARYDTLSRHLTGLPKQPDFLVRFAYTLQGIRVKGNVFPIQTMDWVEGVPLGNWYNARMQAKDKPAILKMATDFQTMVYALQALKIAHGDLQHGNIMVRGDQPVLVDYDGMCVPALIGADATEAGLPAYQHPQRPDQKLGLSLDHFASWIILIALRASAADAKLYQRFVVDTENENLLFSPTDIAQPGDSALWPELLKSSDPEVRGWAKDLRNSIDKPFAKIPLFQSDPYAALVDLCAAPVSDWEAIQAQADAVDAAGKKATGTVPPFVPTKIAIARKKVASCAALQAAYQTSLQTGDPRPVIAAFDPAIYADWPKKQGLMKQAQRVVEKGKALQDLDAATRALPADGRQLIATWERVKAQLADVEAARPFGREAEQWQARLDAASAFLRASGGSATERSLADLWTKVKVAGPPHPDLTAVHKARGPLALDRATRLDALRKVPTTPSEAADGSLVKSWDEALFNGCREADPFRTRVTEARRRLAAVAAIGEAIRKADAGAGSEAAIVAAATALSETYEFAQKSRSVAARAGEERFAQLKTVLLAAEPSDLAISNEWIKLNKEHPKQAALLDAERKKRCELAVRRRKTMEALLNVPKTTPDAFQQDRQILTIWESGKAEMQGSAELPKLVQRIKLAEVRFQAWARLDQVLKSRDLTAIHAAIAPAGLPQFRDYPPVKRNLPQIDELLRIATRVADIRAKLKADARSRGLSLTSDDLAFLRIQGKVFDAPTRASVQKLLSERLWTVVQLRPGLTPYQAMPGPMPMAKVFWTWSGFGLVSWFQIATASVPLTTSAEAERDRLSTCRPEDHQRDGGGKLVVLGTGANVVVTLWPVLDLGWTPLVGPPIHIGPIPSASGGGR